LHKIPEEEIKFQRTPEDLWWSSVRAVTQLGFLTAWQNYTRRPKNRSSLWAEAGAGRTQGLAGF
jgi:hypothetical protein